MGAHLPFMHQVLVACPSPPHPRVLLLHSPNRWLEVCRDRGTAHPTERAGPNACSQYLLHPYRRRDVIRKEDQWKQQEINTPDVLYLPLLSRRVAADATLSGTAGGVPIPSVETLGKSSFKF